MATVYLAVQETFDREVALKVMAEHLVKDESYAARFLREARLVAKMSHQNIVPVFDVGAAGNYHYMAMEHLPGGDLKKKMRAGLALRDSVNIVEAIALGLSYAGSKNLVHRDIKPENILFRDDGSPVISDFGIARQADSKTNMTMAGAVIGTPHYMSPEQAEGVEVDPRSDLYSLGIIVYEMLTGHVPFQGDSAVSIGIKHITEAPPPLPSQVAEFQEFIDIALAKHPEDRFQTGADFAEDLVMVAEDLAEAGATVIIAQSDVKRSSRDAARVARTSANRSRRTRASRIRRAEPAPVSALSHLRIIAVVAAAISILAIASIVLLDPFDTDRTDNAPLPSVETPRTDKVASTIFGSKAARLIENAEKAMQENRLFQPAQDNAQYYLTTLLALIPNNQEGKTAITRLFVKYLDLGQEAVEQKRLREASLYLNQASQIAFYITDQDLTERYSELHRKLNSQKQRILINQENSKLIDDLISKANEALENDALTMPSDNNAYALFLQVLVKDPDNKVAKSGISRVAERLLEKAKAKASESAFGVAKAFVAAAIQVAPQHAVIQDVQAFIAQAEETAAAKALDAENDQMAERVLQSAPAGLEAIQDKEKIAIRYVELSRKAIGENKFGEADQYLSQAKKVSSAQAEIATVERLLRETRKTAQLNSLLAKAESAMKRGRLTRPDGDSALNYYRQVFAIEPQNAKASEGMRALESRFEKLVMRAIDNKKFAQADAYLETWKTFSASPKHLQSVMDQVRKAAAKRDEKVASLLAEAGDIAARKITPKRNDRLRAIYQQALRMNGRSRVARKGLYKTSVFEAKLARDAIDNKKFDQARNHISIIAETTPRFSDLTRLRVELDAALVDALADNDEVNALVTEAEDLISRPYRKPGFLGSNDKARSVLVAAYGKIDRARSLLPWHASVLHALGELERKYSSIISLLMEDGDFEEAEKFVRDTRQFNWSGNRVTALEKQLARKKSLEEKTLPRAIGAF
ncbi:MAG: hypothetical protein CSA50_07385 [Gammaproteobacteria bacterium]|nr:MAG: hypothetical protein CSA50_07385 [Gammaproteobacteria bacterium]